MTHTTIRDLDRPADHRRRSSWFNTRLAAGLIVLGTLVAARATATGDAPLTGLASDSSSTVAATQEPEPSVQATLAVGNTTLPLLAPTSTSAPSDPTGALSEPTMQPTSDVTLPPTTDSAIPSPVPPTTTPSMPPPVPATDETTIPPSNPTTQLPSIAPSPTTVEPLADSSSQPLPQPSAETTTSTSPSTTTSTTVPSPSTSTTTSTTVPSPSLTVLFVALDLPALRSGETLLLGDSPDRVSPWKVINNSNSTLNVSVIFSPLESAHPPIHAATATATLRRPNTLAGTAKLLLCPGAEAVMDVRIAIATGVPDGPFTGSLRFFTSPVPADQTTQACGYPSGTTSVVNQ